MESPGTSGAGGSHSVDLKEFYVFNPTFGDDHDDELGKILYYYPSDTHVDTQLKHVGLCEAIIRFSENFSSETPCEALHTQKSRYVFFQPEPNYWFTMVLSVPSVIRQGPGGVELIDYFDDQVQTNVFHAVLIKLYRKLVLRYDKLDTVFRLNGIEGLKETLRKSFQTNLHRVQTNQCGIVEIFQGIHFLPVDRQMFLNVQCFTNQLLLSFPQIKYLLLLQGEKLIWTGVSQSDIQVLYEYLTKELLSQHFLTGPNKKSTYGFIVKKKSHVTLYDHSSSSYSGPSTNGSNEETVSEPNGHDDGETSVDSFFTASPSSNTMSRRGSTGTVTRCQEQPCRKRFHLLVYKADQSYMTIFLEETEALDVNFMINLETFLSLYFCPLAKLLGRDHSSPNSSGNPISGIATSIMGLASSFHSPSLDSIPPNIKFLYFNNLNMAVKITPGAQIEVDSYRMLADLKEDLAEISESGEIVVKLVSEPCAWIVAKVSNGREFYAIFNNKTANNITEIDEEVKKFTDTHLSNIFFQD